jgi:hypothetical protein
VHWVFQRCSLNQVPIYDGFVRIAVIGSEFEQILKGPRKWLFFISSNNALLPGK